MCSLSRWHIRLRSFVACSALMMCGVAHSATYYVDQNNIAASDVNPGTENKPWVTLYPSTRIALQPGDVVMVKKGKYTSDTGANRLRAMINPKGSGTADKPIIFKAVPEFSVIIEGNPELDAPVQLLASSHVNLEGFIINNPGKAGIIVAGASGKSVSGISLRNNIINGAQNAFAASDTDGIRVMNAENVVIENNRISNIRDGALTENAAAVKLYDTKKVRISNNEIKSVTTGIFVRSDGDSIQIDKNIISEAEVGIKVSSADKTRIRHVSIAENIIHSVEVAVQLQPYGGTVDLVSLNNNVFSDYSVAAMQSTQPGMGKIKIWNNIFDTTGTGPGFIADLLTSDDPPVTITRMDFNLFTKEPVIVTGLYSTNRQLSTLNAWKSYAEFDAHSLVAPAKFRNVKESDFHLSEDSYARAKGRKDGELRAAVVDIGAFPGNDVQIGFSKPYSSVATAKAPRSKPPSTRAVIAAKPAATKPHKTDRKPVEATSTPAARAEMPIIEEIPVVTEVPVAAQQPKPTVTEIPVQAEKPVKQAEHAEKPAMSKNDIEANKIALALANPEMSGKPKNMRKDLEWEVRRALRFNGNCVLESNKIDFYDGYDNTGLAFRVVNDELYLLTHSNIDMSFKDVGVQVGNNTFLHAEKIVGEQNVIFKKELPTLIAQLRKTREARIQLRFWPTYPATQAYSEVVNLEGFLTGYDQYQACKRGN